MKYTQHYMLKQPEENDFVRVTDLNENAETVDSVLFELDSGKEALLATAPVKEAPEDADEVVFVEGKKAKTRRLTWSAMKAALGAVFSALAHTHTMSSIVGLAEQIGEILSALSKKASKTPPPEWLTPAYDNGWMGYNDIDGLRYGVDGGGHLCLDGLLRAPGATTTDTQVLALPVGYRPAKRQVWLQGITTAGKPIIFRLTAGGRLYAWASLPQAAAVIAIPCCSFATPTNAKVALATPVRMAVPATRKTRAAAKRGREKRLMCVVDADGQYVEFVEVTVTYDDKYETEGALFEPYCYALKDGESLVESPKPPTIRPHAGADGFIAPVWEAGSAVWEESATAEEIAAWETEHPVPELEPMDELTMTQLAVAELAQATEDNNTANQLAIAELAETILGGAV